MSLSDETPDIAFYLCFECDHRQERAEECEVCGGPTEAIEEGATCQ